MAPAIEFPLRGLLLEEEEEEEEEEDDGPDALRLDPVDDEEEEEEEEEEDDDEWAVFLVSRVRFETGASSGLSTNRWRRWENNGFNEMFPPHRIIPTFLYCRLRKAGLSAYHILFQRNF